MNSLGNYVTAVRMHNREGFMRSYPHPFLMMKLEDIMPAEGQSGDDWAGQTRTTKAIGKTGSFAVLRHNASIYRIFAMVAKAGKEVPTVEPDPEAAYTTTLSIGRAAENDIVIAENAISKRHANFLCDKSGEWYLQDLGSRNGSAVNGRRVAANEPVNVSFGDPMLLGGLALMIIGAGALYEIVAAQMAASRAEGAEERPKR